jgi:hypothetical protein
MWKAVYYYVHLISLIVHKNKAFFPVLSVFALGIYAVVICQLCIKNLSEISVNFNIFIFLKEKKILTHTYIYKRQWHEPKSNNMVTDKNTLSLSHQFIVYHHGVCKKKKDSFRVLSMESCYVKVFKLCYLLPIAICSNIPFMHVVFISHRRACSTYEGQSVFQDRLMTIMLMLQKFLQCRLQTNFCTFYGR